jgi:hypothetical protein
MLRFPDYAVPLFATLLQTSSTISMDRNTQDLNRPAKNQGINNMAHN